MLAEKLWIAAVAAGALMGSQAAAAPYFTENFENYADTVALQSTWTVQTSAIVTAENNLALNTSGFNPQVNGKGDPGFAPNPLPTITYDATDSVNTLTEVSKLGRFTGPSSGANPVSAYRSFTANTAGFKVSADMIMEAYSRNVGFAIFNSAGTSGYVLRWQATNVNQNGGRGVLQLYRYATNTAAAFDITATGDYDGDAGVDLGNHAGNTTRGVRPVYTADANNVPGESNPAPYSLGASGNGMTPVLGYSRRSGTDAQTGAVTDANLINFDVTWQGIRTFTLVFTPNVTRANPFNGTMETGGQLVVYVNSLENPNVAIPVFDVIDPNALSATTFERFYLFGRHAHVDNIVVDALPEPASLGLVGLIGSFLFRRRRRPVSC